MDPDPKYRTKLYYIKENTRPDLDSREEIITLRHLKIRNWKKVY